MLFSHLSTLVLQKPLWSHCRSKGISFHSCSTISQNGDERQKRTTESSCLLPAGTRTFSLLCQFWNGLSKEVSITSLERLFNGLRALTAKMALIFLRSVFFCFILFFFPVTLPRHESLSFNLHSEAQNSRAPLAVLFDFLWTQFEL
jgi:hypothetical protein